MNLEVLLEDLKNQPKLNNVKNPYTNQGPLQNLQSYFLAMNKAFSGDLLVGEAPGWKGCALTGVPFTSPRILKSQEIELFTSSKYWTSCDTSESTATIVWEFFKDHKKLPLFWNAFPFHPYQPDNDKKNRPPSNEELNIGRGYLEKLIMIYKPRRIFAVGRKAENNLHIMNENFLYIRHPSNGGKREFVANCTNFNV